MASRADAAPYERARQAALEERGNVSRRGATKAFARRFETAVDDFHRLRVIADGVKQPHCALRALPNAAVARVVAEAFGEDIVPLLDDLTRVARADADDPTRVRPPAGVNFRVMLRKRPLLRWETASGEADVVTCDARGRRVTLHDGQMSRNGRTLTMTHRMYTTHAVFSGEATRGRATHDGAINNHFSPPVRCGVYESTMNQSCCGSSTCFGVSR